MHFDVITIGAATQDVFLRSSKLDEVPNKVAPDGYDTCIPLGAKIGIDEMVFATGGGATNAAVTFGRLGLKAACISRVGNDEVGHTLKTILKDDGVDTSFIQQDEKEKTAYSVILISGHGHRAILTFRGASLNLEPKEFPWQKEKMTTNWIYLTSVAGNTRILDEVFDYADRVNAKIAWNPGNGELALGLKGLETYMNRTEVLMLNREEAALLTELPPRQLDQIIDALHPYPKLGMCITDGQNGAYVHADVTTYFAPPLPAHRINTTGAGDAFGSGFVAGIIKGLSYKDALRLGMINATNVIQNMGAKAGIIKSMPSEKHLSLVIVCILGQEEGKAACDPATLDMTQMREPMLITNGNNKKEKEDVSPPFGIRSPQFI